MTGGPTTTATGRISRSGTSRRPSSLAGEGWRTKFESHNGWTDERGPVTAMLCAAIDRTRRSSIDWVSSIERTSKGGADERGRSQPGGRHRRHPVRRHGDSADRGGRPRCHGQVEAVRIRSPPCKRESARGHDLDSERGHAHPRLEWSFGSQPDLLFVAGGGERLRLRGDGGQRPPGDRGFG